MAWHYPDGIPAFFHRWDVHRLKCNYIQSVFLFLVFFFSRNRNERKTLIIIHPMQLLMHYAHHRWHVVLWTKWHIRQICGLNSAGGRVAKRSINTKVGSRIHVGVDCLLDHEPLEIERLQQQIQITLCIHKINAHLPAAASSQPAVSSRIAHTHLMQHPYPFGAHTLSQLLLYIYFYIVCCTTQSNQAGDAFRDNSVRWYFQYFQNVGTKKRIPSGCCCRVPVTRLVCILPQHSAW